MTKSALKGVKILEFATDVSGPYCAKLLADLGADVIKVEAPEGDPARLAGPFPKSGPHPERSALFLYNNTSKRGVVLDLGRPEGLEVFRRFAAWADALVDNHPRDHLESFGLGWEALQRVNPGLVYTSITPYGRTGPRAGAQGGEVTLSHTGGLGNLLPARAVDVDRAPVKLGGHPVGYHGGIAAALATAAVLFGRSKTGKGSLVDISLQEVILNLVAPGVLGTRYHHTTWCRVPDRPPAMGRMKTKDGYVILNAFDDHHFRSFRQLMGNPEWAAGDEWDSMEYRNHHLKEITPMLDAWMAEQEKEDIHQKAAKKGIPIGPIATAKEVMENPQYRARGYFVDVDHPEAGRHRYAGWPYKMSETPARVSRPAPLLGEHTEEVCRGLLGYSAADFERLLRTGAVRSNQGADS